MSEAVLGVIVGAITAGGFSLLSVRLQASWQDGRDERRRIQDDKKAELTARGAEATVVAGVEAALDKLAEGLPADKKDPNANWPSNPQRWTADWDHHRDLLSQRWDPVALKAAYSAYGRVFELERGMGNKGSQAMNGPDRGFCERSRKELESALLTLRGARDGQVSQHPLRP
jgi:hypothetical protein